MFPDIVAVSYPLLLLLARTNRAPVSTMDGLPGGCNPADVLFKLAHGRGIKAPIFEQVGEQGPPHAKTFAWSCSFFEVMFYGWRQINISFVCVQNQYTSVGHGRSKKEAKNAAAKNLISQLDLSTLPVKPQRPDHPKKRKADGNDEHENNGDTADAEANPRPKKKKGNRLVGFNPGPMGMGNMGMGNMGMGLGNMGMGHHPGYGGPGMVPMYGYGYGFHGGRGYGGHLGKVKQWIPRKTFEDRHVLDKHRDIYPEEEELKNILRIVDKVERALKKISDKFFEDGEGSEREITGVARVGDLAKSLLLRGDKNVDLVVLSKDPPTKTLLESIIQSLEVELQNPTENHEIEVKEEMNGEAKTEEVVDKYEVVMHAEVSGLYVNTADCRVTITLTSTQLRSNEDCNGDDQEEDEEAKTEDNEESKENVDTEDSKDNGKENVDLLPADHGLKGLAQLRRAKWFAAMAAPLPCCPEAIRVMKDKARRDPVWALVGDWALELLVERSLYSAGCTLTPSKSIMR